MSTLVDAIPFLLIWTFLVFLWGVSWGRTHE